jgi:hypothetical protein
VLLWGKGGGGLLRSLASCLRVQRASLEAYSAGPAGVFLGLTAAAWYRGLLGSLDTTRLDMGWVGLDWALFFSR